MSRAVNTRRKDRLQHVLSVGLRMQSVPVSVPPEADSERMLFKFSRNATWTTIEGFVDAWNLNNDTTSTTSTTSTKEQQIKNWYHVRTTRRIQEDNTRMDVGGYELPDNALMEVIKMKIKGRAVELVATTFPEGRWLVGIERLFGVWTAHSNCRKIYYTYRRCIYDPSCVLTCSGARCGMLCLLLRLLVSGPERVARTSLCWRW